MQRRFAVGRRESGASTLEYAATFAIAAVVIIAVVWAARLTPVGPLLSDAVCKVSAAVGIGACVDGPEGDGGEQTDPADVDLPDGHDPDSELVQRLLSTESGRRTLQWLSDNNIPIVIDPAETGAYWNGTEIVLGQGYDDAAVVVHEEVTGVVEQIKAAQELRIAGYTIGRQPAEGAFDTAYQQAIQNGQTRAQAERAGWEAVRGEFYNGNIVTSTNGQSYPDYYGDYWDSVN